MWRRLGLDLARAAAGAALSSGAARRACRRLRGGRGRRVALFYYHRVFSDDVQPLYQMGIPRDLFRRQIADLARLFRFVPFEEAAEAALRGGAGEDIASLSFDDGYRDNLVEALPVLREFGVPATIFLVAGAVGAPGPLWYDEVKNAVEHAAGPRFDLPASLGGGGIGIGDVAARRRAFREIMARLRTLEDGDRRRAVGDLASRSPMAAADGGGRDALLSWEDARAMEREGVRFGSHTLSHPLLPRIADRGRLREELAGSLRLLRENLSNPLPALAYPEGLWSGEAAAIARDCGYRWAVTTMPGDLAASDDPLLLPRRALGPVSSVFAGRRHSRSILTAESAGLFDGPRRRVRARRAADAASSARHVALAFNGKAEEYLKHREGDPAFEGEAAEIARMLPSPSGRLVEVGCGVGITSRRFADAGWTVIASDLSMEMVRRVRVAAGSSGTAPIAGALRCDARHMPFSDGSVGAVVCHGVLEYVADIEGTVGELGRVIAPGGVLVATIPSRLSPAIWAAAVLGFAARRLRGRAPAARVRATHLFPRELDALARRAGLVREGATTATFALLPPAFFPRRWLVVNNAIMNGLPRTRVFRWWGAQYVARYDKPR